MGSEMCIRDSYSCEEKFGVEIPDEESKNLRTVGDAVKYIEDHQS